MKQFLLNTGWFFVLVLGLVVFVFCQADGHADAFYLRLTSPKQKSLVIGTSRAAQGILPNVLNTELKRKDIYNYAFTVAHSPYGPVYLNSIKKKLDTTNANGVFVLTIDPWSISSASENPDDASKFIENDKFLNTVSYINYKPNIEYLFFNYESSYINLFKTNSKMVLHEDGWLEVTPRMDDRTNISRINERVSFYRDSLLPNYKFSKLRFEHVLKTINFLDNYGNVYLVRLPIHPEMMAIENQLMPKFDSIIYRAIEKSKIYYDLTPLNSEFKYTDGNHLYKASGKRVSKLIAQKIKAQN
jgi:hypothetical protein